MAAQKRPLVPALDGLRAVASLIVLLSHYSNETGFLRFYAGWGAGQVGVILFFALSGFLMCYVTEGLAPTRANILTFWQRRIARVLPLFYFIVLLSYFLGKQTLGGESLLVYKVTDENLLGHLLLMKGASVLWTIPVEICFYMVFPAIWYLRTRLNNDSLLILILLVITIFWVTFCEYAWAAMNTDIQFLALIRRAHVFLLGIVAYLVFNMAGPMRTNWLWLALMLLVPLNFPHFARMVLERRFDPWVDPAVLLILPCLLLATVRSDWAEQVLGNPVLRYLGNISYSLYLTHRLVLEYMQKFYVLDKSLLSLATVSILAVALSSVTYFLIEKPSRSYLNRLGRKRPVQATSAAGP